MQKVTIDVDPRPLANYFADKNIRIIGNASNPLFLAADIAAQINDQHLHRAVRNYSEKYLVKLPHPTDKDKTAVNYFTEKGLYKYLLSSRSAAAEEFQEWVFDILTKIRMQIIDDATLKIKILRNNMDMMTVSTYDDSRADSCPRGLCEFYIARYIASLIFNNYNIIDRESIPENVTEILHKIAVQYYKKDQQEFKKITETILEKIIKQ